MCMLLFAITNWTIMMSPRQVEVQSFSFKVEFSEKKIFKFWMCMEILYSLSFCSLCVFFFYRKSWLCTCNIIQTGKLPVNLLKVWKFENYSLLIWLQAVHKLPVMVEKLRVENNYYNYWLIIEVLFVVIHSATAVNLKACNHFRLYNGKAAEVSSQEKNWH